MLKNNGFSATKEKMMCFLGYFFLLLSIFAFFFNESFINDHVSNLDPKMDLKGFKFGGRWLTRLLCVIQQSLVGTISKFHHQEFLQLTLFVYLAVALSVLFYIYKPFFEEKKAQLLVFFLLGISIANAYAVEMFTYIAWELGIGVLLAILAVYFFSKKKNILCILFVYLSCSIYQSFIAIYLSFATLYVFFMLKGELSKKAVLENVKVVMCGGIAALANTLLDMTPVMSRNEVEMETVISSAETMATAQASTTASIGLLDRFFNLIPVYRIVIGNCYGYYKSGVVLGLILFSFLVILVKLLLSKRLKDVIYLTIFYILMNLYYVAIFILEANPWPPQRVSWPMFCSLASFLILVVYFCDMRAVKEMVIAVFVLFFAYNIYVTETAILDFYVMNQLDKQIALSIETEIERYEEETGTQVIYISARKMEDPDYYYKKQQFIAYQGVTYSHKTMYDDFSNVELINFISGRKYEEKHMSEEIFKEHFADVTYDQYVPEKQLYFEGDTLYWLIY